MTPKEKLQKLAKIMHVNVNTIIMDPASFEIEELYVDETQTIHYKVVLKTGETVIEKKHKI